MRLPVACVAAALSGFIGLSYEILWVRTYSFATEGPPDAFGLFIAAYLVGLAFGAFVAGEYCRRAAPGRPQLAIVGAVMALTSSAAFLVIPATARLVSARGLGASWPGVPPESTLPLFAVAAAGLGAGLPLLSHFAIPADARAGGRLSYVVVGNIVGSALGSLATGLWLLDAISLRGLNTALATAGSALGAALVVAELTTPLSRVVLGATAALLLGLFWWCSPALHDQLYERLLYKHEFVTGDRFAHTVEGRSGVVSLTTSGVVYGNGSYDGQTNTDPLPRPDDNRVLRAYLVPAFHPRPQEILMVGLGAGAWLQVLANLDEVTRITVVEIDPGYVEVMRQTPTLASALENPKVEIIIDDGRRYLGRASQRFDVVIQNTIVYWRAHAANLLSREYLAMSRRCLEPGGILYLNATYSAAAQKTAATVFPYAMRYQNMLIASDEPFEIDHGRFERKLEQWRIDGRPVLPPGVRAAELDLLREQDWRGIPTWEGRESILRRTQAQPAITDDNMANEWWDLDTYP
ncbi:methyltransferase domain-containing protein [Sorangium sp. So ce118]